MKIKIGCDDRKKFNEELKKLQPDLSVKINTNETGYKGVYKNRNQYVAQIRIKNKCHHLGIFCDPKEAHAAYLKAKKDLKQ